MKNTGSLSERVRDTILSNLDAVPNQGGLLQFPVFPLSALQSSCPHK